MASITIGEIKYDIDEYNFIALERAYPYIQEATLTPNPVIGMSAGICVIAAGIIESKSFNLGSFNIKEEELKPTVNRDDQVFDLVVTFLKRNMKASETPMIAQCVNEIIQEAGLEPKPGEEEDEESQNLSTVTLPQS